MEIKEVLKVWEEYAKDLFEDEGRGDIPMLNNELEGPEILEEEIRYAMKTMKKGKSAGNDKITIEMIEASGDYGLRKITELTNKIYDTTHRIKTSSIDEVKLFNEQGSKILRKSRIKSLRHSINIIQSTETNNCKN